MSDKPDLSQSPDLIINQLRTSWSSTWWEDLVNENKHGTYAWDSTNVTYAFPDYLDVSLNPVTHRVELTTISMTDAEKVLAREAFEMWDDLIAINLTEATSGNIHFQYAPLDTSFAAATDWDPDESTLSSVTIQVNTNDRSNFDSNLGYGRYGFATYIHEIGHSLGLSHPGAYNAVGGDPTYENNAEYRQDTEQYTVMSYFEAGWDIHRNIHGGSNPATPMLHDILTVQAVYGADLTTRTGGDVYGFNSSFSGPFRGAFDFTQNRAPVVAIWDAGGNDTLDCSGFTSAQTIDLHAGTYSSVGGLLYNVAIAFNCIIENAVGGSGFDKMFGNEVNNRLEGGLGDDTLIGGAGTDTLVGGDGNDMFDHSLGGTGSDPFDPVGASGGDIMIGGAGDDEYWVDTADHAPSPTDVIALAINGLDPTIHNGDQVIENPGEGHDTVISMVTYRLTANVEDLTLAQNAGSINGYGNNLDNVINGNDGLNTLYGYDGNDTLDGGVGADTMVGGTGSDSYYVDTAATSIPMFTKGGYPIFVYLPGDQVIENPNEGLDTVSASITYTLPDNVERLTLAAGAGNINGYGNGLDNTISGNDGVNTLYGYGGDDRLIGAGGADTMVGGTGNDSYYVETAATSTIIRYSKGGYPIYVYLPGDQVIENPNEGHDTVSASISYALPDNVEDLLLIGNNDLAGYGNDLANRLFGNSGNNALSGGAGIDLLVGGLGRDMLTGGVDGDVFDFNYLAESAVGASNRDIITNFERGLDVIDITNIDANTSLSGDQGFRFVGTRAFGGGAGELRYESFDQPDTANDVTVLSGDVNGDRIADFEIEITGIVQLSSQSFLL